MVAEIEKEIDSLPDERVALRRSLRSSGPDSPQASGEVIQQLGEGAERLLRDRSYLLLERHEASRNEQ